MNKVDVKYLSVSKRGYGIEKCAETQDTIEQLKKMLTVKPKINPEAIVQEANEFGVYLESNTKLYIPIALGYSQFKSPEKYNLPPGEIRENLVFNGTLRKEQEEPVSRFLKNASDPRNGLRGGIISLACAAGKTVMGLYIICELKRKAIIVCHKEFLLNQWRERISQFIPTARVGLIKGKIIDVKDKDIVLASLQSISMKSYPKELFEDIGTAVFDEAHHLGASVFSQAMAKLISPVMLGLSATLNRADGLRKVFEWYLGEPITSKQKSTQCRGSNNSLIVDIIDFYDPHPDFGRELTIWNGKRNIPQMIYNITMFEPRNKLLIDTLKALLTKEPDRKTLVLSHRRTHLKLLENLILQELEGFTVGFYVGGMKQNDLKASETKCIILGTYNMISEGFDVPALNTLVLATPLSSSSIEQCVGRIQRQKPEDRKHTPYIIDIWDAFSIFYNQGKARLKFYQSRGYTTNLDGIEESKEEVTYNFIPEED